MFKLYNGLYGNPDHNATFSRLGSDSEVKFSKNLSNQPADWIYRNKEVTYIRNSCGHRCAETVSDGFVMFTGCSITEGIALALEDTYPYIVADNLGKEYYNLALNGFGPDMVALNLSTWFLNNPIPSLVVIQWPEAHRKFELVNGTAVPVGPWGDRSDNTEYISKDMWNNFERVITTPYMEHYFNVIRTTTLNYLRSKNIPVVEIMPEDLQIVDRARDLSHPGIESHKLLASLVLSR
jgi:hypothetical protein